MNATVDITGTILSTERLILRPFVPDDIEDFYEYASVPGVGEMAGWRHHSDRQESERILAMFINEKKTFAVCINGKVIGSIGIEQYNTGYFPEFEALKARELGFVLSKDYWGRGLMPEAAGAVIRYCFDTLGLDLLICGHYSFNNQSKRAQEKMGFHFYKREPLHYSEIWEREDSGYYSILFRDPKQGEPFLCTVSSVQSAVAASN